MKQLLASVFILAILFASCSTDETLAVQQDTNNKMLESFVVKRNSDGSYTLTTNVTDGVGTIYFDDASKNEIHLINDNTSSRNSLTHNYNVVDNILNIEYTAENGLPQPKLSIFDDNTIQTTSRNTDLGLLDTYSIVTNEDGSIQLEFEVKEGVDVSFGYNQDEDINDIYLVEDSNASDISFSKNFTSNDSDVLKIDFIQSYTSSRESDTKKPRLVFYTPDGD